MRSTRTAHLAQPRGGTIRRLVRRNLGAVFGLTLLAGAAAVAASLATWTIDDPSLSHATDHLARNALGSGGAIVSDLVMQFLGLAVTVFLIPPVIWGWRLLFAVPGPSLRRALCGWLAGSLLAAAALATLDPPLSWPLPTGLGGVLGDLVLRLPRFLMSHPPKGWLSAAFCAGLALPAPPADRLFRRLPGPEATGSASRDRPRPAVRTATVPRVSIRAEEREEEGSDRPADRSIILGAIAHILLSLGGSLRRALEALRLRRRPCRWAMRLASLFDDRDRPALPKRIEPVIRRPRRARPWRGRFRA